MADFRCTLHLAPGQLSEAFGCFPDLLLITLGFVSLRCAGWSDSRLRTSLLRPKTLFCQLGNFASQNFGIFLRSFCRSIAENCGDLRRLSFFPHKMAQRIAENCGDEESAQKLRRKISKSWLAKFPTIMYIFFIALKHPLIRPRPWATPKTSVTLPLPSPSSPLDEHT